MANIGRVQLFDSDEGAGVGPSQRQLTGKDRSSIR